MAIRFDDEEVGNEAQTLSAFLAAVRGAPHRRHRLRLRPPSRGRVKPSRLARDRDVFFQSPAAERPELLHDHVHRRAITLDALPGAVFSPYSHAVLTGRDAVYGPSLVAERSPQAAVEAIAGFDPMFVRAETGLATVDPASLTYDDRLAVPISGAGVHNFGHFLYDGLPLADAIRHDPAYADDIVFVGTFSRPWRDEILGRLGIPYRAVDRPTRFRAVLGSTMLNGHVSQPTPLVRGVFNRLRMGVAVESAGAQPVMLSRGEDRLRPVVNRAEVEAALAAEGVRILDPVSEGLDATIRAVAQAPLVIGETGAGLAHLGFCEPGTRVLEIQPAGYLDHWVRSLCPLFGLDWHAYVAECFDPAAKAAAGAADSQVCLRLDVERVLSAVRSVRDRPS